ncbi:alpha/beta hydrolase family protein [Ulvibacterium sp.]|uniref:alpha/beta hydrolase family protein n=1 Tax=Ulvibacterium sp. TaxID=2665914 RepID=UPI003BAD8559
MKTSYFKNKLIALLILGSITALNACSKGDSVPVVVVDPASTERGALISYQQTGSLAANKIASNGRTIGDVSTFTTNDVTFYRVIYNSLYNGEPTQVSGLVMIPQNTATALPLIQHHHGTIIPESGSEGEVPSNYRGGITENNVETSFIGAVMASNGYVVSLPDYAGYGETSHLEHPYTVHHELAEVSVDMIRAAKNLLNELSIGFSNAVFLTGWSEGGGAGLATHKYLQLNYPGEFTVKGSSLFAGPYDYSAFFSDILENNAQAWDNLSIYSWSTYALNKFMASSNQSNQDIWSYAVANQMDALYVPSNIPNEVFEATFIQNFNNGNNTAFIEAIQENSLLEDWAPVGSLFFHSGTADAIVPHYNSINAHAQFQSVGANSTLYEYAEEDHYTPLYDYVVTTLNDFNSL